MICKTEQRGVHNRQWYNTPSPGQNNIRSTVPNQDRKTKVHQTYLLNENELLCYFKSNVSLWHSKSEFHIFWTRDRTLLTLLTVLSVYLLSNTHTDTFGRFSLNCNLKTFAILSPVHTAKTYKKEHLVTPSPAFIQNGL